MSPDQQSHKSTLARDVVALIVCWSVCFAAAGIGGLFPPDEWYRTLERPSFSPPDWVFGPVWTVLYFIMGVSVWLVWKSSGFSKAQAALTMFGIQLLLNAAWSVIFFGWHQPGLAFLEIVLLWLAIASTIVLFWKHSPAASLLLAPYLSWVSFAAVLNFSFWSLNG